MDGFIRSCVCRWGLVVHLPLPSVSLLFAVVVACGDGADEGSNATTSASTMPGTSAMPTTSTAPSGGQPLSPTSVGTIPGAANPGTADTWRCIEFDGAPDWLCSCEFRPEGSQPPDFTQFACAHPDYPCCRAATDGSECLCEYNYDCESTASFLGEVVVPSCPPDASIDLVELAPGEAEPVCNGGRMSCGNGGRPRCDHVPGSCPTCSNCLDANLDPACVSPDDEWQYLGVPECATDLTPSTIAPEMAEPTCVVSESTFYLDGSEPSALIGVTCVDPATRVGVAGAIPTCEAQGAAIPVCDALRISCALGSERDLAPAQRTPLGPPTCTVSPF